MSIQTSARLDAEVTQIRYAERHTRRSEAFHRFEALDAPDAEIDMDYSFWLVRTPGELMLVDTGYDLAAKDWLQEQPVIDPPVALAQLGVDAAEVTCVIASHFHYDHIGYLGAYVNARIIAGQAEFDHWMPKLRAGALEGEFAAPADLEAVDRAHRDGRLRLVAEPTEVIPGVVVVPAPGHTPGQLLTYLATDPPLLLTSDAAHLYEQVTLRWPFFAFHSLDDALRASDLIRSIRDETGAEVVPGHDARVREAHPAAAGAAGSFATVLRRSSGARSE